MDTRLYFSLRISGLDEFTFDVVEFNLYEALSTLFTLTVNASSPKPDVDINELLLQKASLQIKVNGVIKRTVNGIIEQACQGEIGFKRCYYSVKIRPELWLLTLTQDSRIFHFKSVPDILNALLQKHSVRYLAQLHDPHSVREYTTQKRETDYDFFCRLAAEEGITFWFEENQLVYSDSHLGMTRGAALIYNVHPQPATKEYHLYDARYASRMTPNEAYIKDYRYSHPDVQLDFKSGQNGRYAVYSVYDSYGRFNDEAQGKQFARYRMEALRAESALGQAKSNCGELMPGQIFELTEHPSGNMNNVWQVVRITHKGTLPQAVADEGNANSDDVAQLTNEFEFISGKTDWRPPFLHKPLADGDETAVVVGPEGEEIYVNEDGAVKVHFHWNRYDAANENASCWVRVAQNWNGNGFGFLATPRIGQEVIVSYLNGDIDRPIITGTVYSGNNRPPVKLPESKTQMTIKSKTHKGEGFNELRFEDENGKQEVFIHAQKNMNTKVLNNHTVQVHNDSHLQVENERSETINGNRYQHQKAEEHHLTESDRKTQIMANDYKTVGVAQHETIGTVKTVQAGTEIHLKSGVETITDGGLSLTLKAGGQHIILNPAGIWLSTPAQLGGSPVAGTLASPSLPTSKQQTVTATPAPPASELANFKNSSAYGEENLFACGKQTNGACTRGAACPCKNR